MSLDKILLCTSEDKIVLMSAAADFYWLHAFSGNFGTHIAFWHFEWVTWNCLQSAAICSYWVAICCCWWHQSHCLCRAAQQDFWLYTVYIDYMAYDYSLGKLLLKDYISQIAPASIVRLFLSYTCDCYKGLYMVLWLWWGYHTFSNGHFLCINSLEWEVSDVWSTFHIGSNNASI